MQDITEDICRVTPEGREAQLEDRRDGNKYWVGKMKDGGCWMLQNLALGNSYNATTLTSANSDVSSDWELPVSKTTPSGSSASTAVQSWNFGKWVLATPLLTTDCGNSTAGQAISRCTRVGFVDVNNNFQPTYTATTGTWNGATVTSNTLVAVNCTSWSGSGTSKTCTAGTYDPHYLVGNYYSWNAATAGTGGGGNGSICPKGWELPYTTPPGTLVSPGVSYGKKLEDLLEAYGIETSLTGTVNGTTYNIAGSPLRFVRSGGVDVTNSYITIAGQGGYYWSSTPNSSTRAYILNFTASSVDSARNYPNRYTGFPVRCVAHWSNVISVPAT